MNKEMVIRLAEGYVRQQKRDVRLETELGKYHIEVYDYSNPLVAAAEEVLDTYYEGLVECLLDLVHHDETVINDEKHYTVDSVIEAVSE